MLIERTQAVEYARLKRDYEIAKEQMGSCTERIKVAILELTEAGVGPRQIGRILGISNEYVMKIKKAQTS